MEFYFLQEDLDANIKTQEEEKGRSLGARERLEVSNERKKKQRIGIEVFRNFSWLLT